MTARRHDAAVGGRRSRGSAGHPALRLSVLVVYAQRTPSLERLARWQIEGYARIVAEWCQESAGNAGETCAVPFDTLGRVLVGSVIGIVLHYLSDRDPDRARRDLQAAMEMLVDLADVRSATHAVDG